jgi:proprotein convertase subtilisin/kexin type 2
MKFHSRSARALLCGASVCAAALVLLSGCGGGGGSDSSAPAAPASTNPLPPAAPPTAGQPPAPNPVTPPTPAPPANTPPAVSPPPAPAPAPNPVAETRNCDIRYSIIKPFVTTGTDPNLSLQWHLNNTAGTRPIDIRAFSAWATNKGEGVRIAVVDDAIEINHPDLLPNIIAGGSYNYFGNGDSPLPCFAVDNHGTEVAGIIASRDNNAIGGAGVAPRSQLVGFNSLSAGTDVAVIDSMQRDSQLNQIYNNSWGSTDDGFLHPADASWSAAIDSGLKTGRAGKGSIYVFAAGNGGAISLKNNALHVENSNFDGYVNRIGLVSVCSTDDNGERSFFSEFGVNLLVCAPSNSSARGGISTTTIKGAYTADFAGTSASAPMVSGVIALMLSANPKLTWRDVPIILAQSAQKTSLSNVNWNGTGVFRYNPFFGFGVVDAKAAVELATNWQSVGDSSNLEQCSLTRNPNLSIPDALASGTATTVGDVITVSAADCKVKQIEYIDLNLTTDHIYQGELKFELKSPSGTASQLTYPQSCGRNLSDADNPCKQLLDNWRFGVIRHMNENPLGSWRLEVTDTINGSSGKLNTWTLKIYGRP